MTWAVIQTEPQREQAVHLLLERSNYETYLPRIRWRGRIAPLFPSYLFIRLYGQQFYAIRWTPHVARLLMAGDRPALLREHVVSEIRKRERDGLVKLPSPPRQFRKGQQIRIVRGSFEGQIGIYEGMSGQNRERVLLELLGQAVPVELPAKDIAPYKSLR